MLKKITIVLYSLFLLTIGVLTSFAQSADAYKFYIMDEFPAPGETVTINIHPNEQPVQKIKSVIWTIGGRVISEHKNSLKIEYLVKNTPEQVVADITYIDRDENRYTLQVSKWIAPVIFDILWEGLSATTPLYDGYRLVHRGTPVRITSTVQYIDSRGNIFDENDFFFDWEQSSHKIEQGSGKNSIIIEDTGSTLRNEIPVTVKISLPNNNRIQIRKTIFIPFTESRVFLYKHSLSRGLNTRRVVVDNDIVVDDPFTVSVYPFYFSRNDFEKNSVQYWWFVNNQPNPINEARRVSLSYEGEGTPTRLSVQIQNDNEKYQKISKSLNLRF